MTDGIGAMWAVVSTSMDAEYASVWLQKVLALSHIERWANIYCERYNRKLVKEQCEKHRTEFARRENKGAPAPLSDEEVEKLYQRALTADEPCIYVGGWAIVVPAPEVRYTDIFGDNAK